MLKSTLIGIAVAVAFSLAPATAQEASPGTEQQELSIVGLSISSSDGEKLGEIMHVGMYQGTQAVLAEVSNFLGMGTTAVLVPMDMVIPKGDRVELSMTAEEVRQTISNVKPER